MSQLMEIQLTAAMFLMIMIGSAVVMRGGFFNATGLKIFGILFAALVVVWVVSVFCLIWWGS